MATESGSPATWHALLARLVIEQGGAEAVARRLVEARAGQSADDMETAQRELRNWTTGKSVPSRQSFTHLSQALRMSEDPARTIIWNELYQEARLRSADEAKVGPSLAVRSVSMARSARIIPYLFVAAAIAAVYWLLQP